jgi:phage shock protein PspC (stress-responsive transcriptional regulator)
VEVSVAGLVGGLVGLAIGYVDYRVVAGVVEGKLRRLDTSSSVEEREVFERKIRIMRVLFFLMTVGAFPVIGYLLGQTVAGRA